MGNIYRARTMSQALLLALTILTYLILIVIFEVLLISPFYRLEEEGTERLNNM